MLENRIPGPGYKLTVLEGWGRIIWSGFAGGFDYD
jgi:hypothetical protein